MEKVKAKIVRGVMLEFVRDCTTAPAPYKTQQVTHKMVHAQLICVPAQVSKCLSGVCQDKQLGQDCECCCLAIIMGTRGFTIGAKSATKLWWQAHCTRAEWNIAQSLDWLAVQVYM